MQVELEHDLKELQSQLESERADLADLTAKAEHITGKLDQLRAERTGDELKLASGDNGAHKRIDQLEVEIRRLDREKSGLDTLQGQTRGRVAELEKAIQESNGRLAAIRLQEQEAEIVVGIQEALEQVRTGYRALVTSLGKLAEASELARRFHATTSGGYAGNGRDTVAGRTAALRAASEAALALGELNPIALQREGFGYPGSQTNLSLPYVTGMVRRGN